MDEPVSVAGALRALVHTSVSDVVFYLGVEGDRFRFREINPMFTRATGLREADVVGKLVDEVIPEPSLSLVLSKYREAIAERRTVRWEEITDYPTGRKHGEVSITPVVDSIGRCTMLVGTVHDVTERARAHALGVAEQRIFEMVASGQPLDRTLDTLVAAVEEQVRPGRVSVDRATGTITLRWDDDRAPTEEDDLLTRRATNVAVIAIRRHQLDEGLRDLSGHIEAAREEERTGIAREIHDQLGQTLTALKMDLAWVARRASGPTGLATDALLEKIREMTVLAGAMIDDVRRISAELRPSVLDDLGLTAALRWQAEEFHRRTAIACRVESELAERVVRRELATAVFRVFQEALTNVARHAGAKSVAVALAHRDGELVFTVEDDGLGIDPQRIDDRRSLGLIGMRERARRLGGTAAFARTEPHGTVVTLRLPAGE